jgi:hypothetical protein
MVGRSTVKVFQPDHNYFNPGEKLVYYSSDIPELKNIEFEIPSLDLKVDCH